MEIKRVLVIGSGGREHALCWKIASSPRVQQVFCAPGNAGIAEDATCVDIKASSIDELVNFAKENSIDLTVIGPEDPLAKGIVDRFREEGLAVFGPSAKAAEIEASKVFTKDLLSKAGVPTGAYRTFSDPDEALDYVQNSSGVPVAVKAEGLAAGKGVILAQTISEAEEAINIILREKAFGEAGNRLIIEEFLTGEEASFMAVTDGKTVLPLATSQDHKAVYDNDQGPNTGGMGAYSPAPVVTESLYDDVMKNIITPTVNAMGNEGRPYTGVLYGGLIISEGNAKVIEYNCRFGDPEAQPILMRLKSDLVDIIEAALEGRLDEITLEWDERPSLCVVLASEGYPGEYEKGKEIHGLDKVKKMSDVKVFHAGTCLEDGRFVTSGGRVLGVTALGDNIKDAIKRAYKAVSKISWEGMFYRRDIGQKALERAHDLTGGLNPIVGIIMGSPNDMDTMKTAAKVLRDFEVPCELKVASAHRSPALAAKYAEEAEARGIKVIIAGAGMAAHLAGAMAAHTHLPIIGVPIDSSPLNGLDSLLSTVQMPPGVPVATVAIGKAGARNAAMLAMQILALSDTRLREKLIMFRKDQAAKIEAMF